MKPEKNSLESLMTIKETAQFLKTCEKTVRRMIGSGKLTALKDGRLVRIAPADLRRYIDRCRALRVLKSSDRMSPSKYFNDNGLGCHQENDTSPKTGL